MKLQKLGGYAAITGVCFSIGYVILRGRLDLMDMAKMMASFSARPAHVVVVELLYASSSILAFAMFLALHERMRADALHLTRIMLIAASARTVAGITVSIGLLMGGMIIIAPAQDASAFRALFAMVMSVAYVGYHAYGWACLLLMRCPENTLVFTDSRVAVPLPRHHPDICDHNSPNTQGY